MMEAASKMIDRLHSIISHHPNQKWRTSWLSNQPTFDISSRSKKRGFFSFLFMYVIQHSFICRPSDSTVSGEAAIEPRAVATLALTARRTNHWARSYPPSARSHPPSARSHPPSARSHPPSARSHPEFKDYLDERSADSLETR
jgi:hypothetical protein